LSSGSSLSVAEAHQFLRRNAIGIKRIQQPLPCMLHYRQGTIRRECEVTIKKNRGTATMMPNAVQ